MWFIFVENIGHAYNLSSVTKDSAADFYQF